MGIPPVLPSSTGGQGSDLIALAIGAAGAVFAWLAVRLTAGRERRGRFVPKPKTA